jgi:DNA-binding transcriptional regulator YhcF (GntR family)
MRSTKSMNIERIKDILTLAKQKPTLSQRELAKELGVSRNTVAKALDKVSDYKEEIELFRKQRGDILDEKQALILRAIDSKKVGEAKLRDLAVAAGILFDKNRLERGFSTSNISSWCSIVAESERRLKAEKVLESANPMRTEEEEEAESQ